MQIYPKQLDLTRLKTTAPRQREYEMTAEAFSSENSHNPTQSVTSFLQKLPKRGEAVALHEAAHLMATTALNHKPIMWVLDAQTIKAGVSPLLIYLMSRGILKYLVMNGEAALGDYELACHGVAFEKIGPGVIDGQFGLDRETSERLCSELNQQVRKNYGFGQAIGTFLKNSKPQAACLRSILASAYQYGAFATVHPTIGAEGFHRYPEKDFGSILGQGGLKDMKNLYGLLHELPRDTLIIATHTQQVLSQVFLSACAMARHFKPEAISGFNLLLLGDADPLIRKIPELGKVCHLPSSLELVIPLLITTMHLWIE